jgi:hypothetical protein
VWLTFLFVKFPISATVHRLCFLSSSSKLNQLSLKQLRLGIPKSVGAQSSADFFFPTQILAVERNFASASAQVLAED